uniref:Uncharacterized protein n=1 Tax=uncultured bacterium A1Q1_fos_517 TaxID=1256582 RepID=L7VWX8_9BACT|nr:hypothetical protein [uncultured bacterium A1Q1_fos_517]
MDPKRLKDVHDRLESLDDRLSYRLRARNAGSGRASLEQLEDRLRDVTEYTLELRTLVQDLLLGLVARPDSEPPAR